MELQLAWLAIMELKTIQDSENWRPSMVTAADIDGHKYVSIARMDLG